MDISFELITEISRQSETIYRELQAAFKLTLPLVQEVIESWQQNTPASAPRAHPWVEQDRRQEALLEKAV